MSHLINEACERLGRRARASGAPRPERGAGSAVAAERSGAALIRMKAKFRKWGGLPSLTCSAGLFS
jgi:hypothetical protein